MPAAFVVSRDKACDFLESSRSRAEDGMLAVHNDPDTSDPDRARLMELWRVADDALRVLMGACQDV